MHHTLLIFLGQNDIQIVIILVLQIKVLHHRVVDKLTQVWNCVDVYQAMDLYRVYVARRVVVEKQSINGGLHLRLEASLRHDLKQDYPRRHDHKHDVYQELPGEDTILYILVDWAQDE